MGELSRPSLAYVLFAVALIPCDARAQDHPDTDRRLRGGAFEAGAVLGAASFQGKSRLDSCRWNGVRFGHRFHPFEGVERLQFGFRLGIEGCITEHEEVGRTDLIYANAGFLLGVRASDSWLIYWFSGVGELLGDTTFNTDGEVDPRFAWHGGPGVTWALSERFLLDASVMGLVFENFDLGKNSAMGTVFAFVPNLMLAIQI